MSSDESTGLEEDLYEIERILKHRKKGKNTEYYIRWKGYDESEDQWVKASDIVAMGVVEAYENTLAAKTPRTKSSRSVASKSKSMSQVGKVTKSILIESDTSDVEMEGRNVVTTQEKVYTELKTSHSKAGIDQVGGGDYYEKVQQKFSKRINKNEGGKLSQLSAPLVIYISCLLTICLSFVWERL